MVAFRASLDGSAAFGEFEQVALDHSDLVAEFDGVDGVEAVVEGSVLGWGERVGVVAKEPVGWGCGGVVAFVSRVKTNQLRCPKSPRQPSHLRPEDLDRAALQRGLTLHVRSWWHHRQPLRPRARLGLLRVFGRAPFARADGARFASPGADGRKLLHARRDFRAPGAPRPELGAHAQKLPDARIPRRADARSRPPVRLLRAVNPHSDRRRRWSKCRLTARSSGRRARGIPVPATPSARPGATVRVEPCRPRLIAPPLPPGRL